MAQGGHWAEAPRLIYDDFETPKSRYAVTAVGPEQSSELLEQVLAERLTSDTQASVKALL